MTISKTHLGIGQRRSITKHFLLTCKSLLLIFGHGRHAAEMPNRYAYQKNSLIMKRYLKKKHKYGEWLEMSKVAEKSVFRLVIGNAQGTCFVVSVGEDAKRNIYETTFITALHVVKNIKQSDEPELFDAHGNRVYDKVNHEATIAKFGDPSDDTAVIVFESNKPVISKNLLLPLRDKKINLGRATEIGWLGYPGFANPNLCFFHGFVSAYDKTHERYLLNGAANQGISGGPAFTQNGELVGLISAYSFDSNNNMPGLVSVVSLEKVRKELKNHDNTIFI